MQPVSAASTPYAKQREDQVTILHGSLLWLYVKGPLTATLPQFVDLDSAPVKTLQLSTDVCSNVAEFLSFHVSSLYNSLSW